jgi:hypothetical protein
MSYIVCRIHVIERKLLESSIKKISGKDFVIYISEISYRR